ncbi:MAG: molecular chaperone TorD family protein [Candidatus Schekmanbacteria bacterium]|nr:molecular chaperone TorD family protein [Candidatus Schekmanbacteria bacterium]
MSDQTAATQQRHRELELLAAVRHAVYRLIASALQYPDAGRVETLQDELARSESWHQCGGQLPLLAAWERLAEEAQAALAATPLLALQTEHVRLFEANAVAPPYESAYATKPSHHRGVVNAELLREYADAGVTLRDSLCDTADYVVVELEIMAHLCRQESRGWAEGAGHAAMRTQAGFLRRHVLRWFPEFARRVVEADRCGFYRAVAGGTVGVLLRDEQWLHSDELGLPPQAGGGEVVGLSDGVGTVSR